MTPFLEVWKWISIEFFFNFWKISNHVIAYIEPIFSPKFWIQKFIYSFDPEKKHLLSRRPKFHGPDGSQSGLVYNCIFILFINIQRYFIFLKMIEKMLAVNNVYVYKNGTDISKAVFCISISKILQAITWTVFAVTHA